MAKLLLIAEKPSVMRDIQKVYQRIKSNYEHEIIFGAFVGHVVEAYRPAEYDPKYKEWKLQTLPIIPSEFKYKPKPSTKDVYDQLVTLIKNENLDGIISATDAGREGELIYWAFDDTIQHNLPVYRYWASDSTEANVEKALRNLIPPNHEEIKNLEIAARLRAEFDWLIGMNMSRAASIKSRSQLALGRVMTPTLKLIVDRELEIQNFKPTSFYEIEGTFGNYIGKWFDAEQELRYFDKKEDAEAVIERLKSEKEGIVVDVEKRERKSTAPTLHSLLELQKEAGKAFGMSAQEVLNIAQALYEEKKLITYPRTDSRHIPKSMANEITKHLHALVDLKEIGQYAQAILENPQHIEKTMKMKRYVDDKKVTDHHAILPTNIKASLGQLSPKETDVYLLIVRRFLSIFMPPQIIDQTTIITQVNNDTFRTRGAIVKEKGFKVLYEGVFREKKDIELPSLRKGERVPFTDVQCIEKETTPPKRFDDPDLLTAMSNVGNKVDEEELKNILKDVAGLGTSATRAGIVENLIDREWLVRKGKTLIPTEKGIEIIQALGERDITSPKLTALWEGKLQEVEAGTLDAQTFKNEMHTYIQMQTQELAQNMVYIGGNKEVVGACPKCQNDVILGKKFYLCTEYSKTCDFLVPLVYANSKITKGDLKKLFNGEKTNRKTLTFRNDKKGKHPLYLDENYKLKIDFELPTIEETVIGTCPKCQGKFLRGLVNKCQNYGSTCDFSFYSKMLGVVLTDEDVLHLIQGKPTSVYQLTFKSGKKGEGSLYFDSKLALRVKFKEEVIGKCPKCSSSVVVRGKYYMCEHYKETCDFIFGDIFGATLSKKEAADVLKGKVTAPKTLTFKSGKSGESTIELKNGRVVPSFFD